MIPMVNLESRLVLPLGRGSKWRIPMSTLLKQCAISVAVAAVFLAGCSQTDAKPAASNQAATVTKPAVRPQVVPAKTAFWEMYTAAHKWAPDVAVLRVTAKELPGFKNEAGNAGMWEAVFASQSLGKYRVYTYSVATVAPDIHKGVVAGLAMPWSGATRDTMPVDLSMFNVDSDAAYKAAAGDAAEWLKQNPGKQISTLEVGDTYKFQGPVWHLVWGDKKSGYATFVDGNSGKVLKHI
jgi:hypothetical protein